jgi:hypothetical protein
MTAAEALSFVERHGVVLESAHQVRIPSLAEEIAGGPLRGSWWSHPDGRAIFAATRALRASPDVLVCRLIAGKISFVHARLWPALVRISGRLPRSGLARLRERHTERGTHRVDTVPFPDWVPASVLAAARHLDEPDACASLAVVLDCAHG